MSTYLVAYVIGAYDYVETRDTNNVLIRVYTPVGKKDRGLFALQVSLSLLSTTCRDGLLDCSKNSSLLRGLLRDQVPLEEIRHDCHRRFWWWLVNETLPRELSLESLV